MTTRNSAVAMADRVTPGAWAVVNDDPPGIFVAENAAVISRVLALKVVASASPSVFTEGELQAVQEHLLHERWAQALLVWMTATDITVDVYEEFVPVYDEQLLNAELASIAIRLSRVFTADSHVADSAAE